MEEMIAARYNVWWYLSIAIPALIMIAGTFWHKKSFLLLAIILSLITTYSLCNISVREKWKTRYEIARTDQEINYATEDGANLVFTAIVIGPFEAVLYTALWGFLGWKAWPKLRKKELLK